MQREARALPSQGARSSRPGISQRFVDELGKTLVPESSAIVALIRRVALDEVLPELALYGGTVMQTSLAPAPGAGR